jgi:hypothetical protein
MPFKQGIQIINPLTADQSVTNSVVPVDITGFSIALLAGERLYWEVTGVFSTAVIGGWRFLAHSTAAPTKYNAIFDVVDITTAAPAGTTYNDAQVAEAAFTNLSAVATNYQLNAKGNLIANGATTFSFQFAQNNAQANNITMLAGMVMKLLRY